MKILPDEFKQLTFDKRLHIALYFFLCGLCVGSGLVFVAWGLYI